MTSDITVQQAKELRLQAQREIHNVIVKLERDLDMCVTAVDLTHAARTDAWRVTAAVELKLEF